MENKDIIETIVNKIKTIKQIDGVSLSDRFKEDLGFEENLDFLNGEDNFDRAFKKYWESQGVFWSTKKHTNAPLPVIFYGDNANVKHYILHNTDLFKIMNNYLNK